MLETEVWGWELALPRALLPASSFQEGNGRSEHGMWRRCGKEWGYIRGHSGYAYLLLLILSINLLPRASYEVVPLEER